MSTIPLYTYAYALQLLSHLSPTFDSRLGLRLFLPLPFSLSYAAIFVTATARLVFAKVVILLGEEV